MNAAGCTVESNRLARVDGDPLALCGYSLLNNPGYLCSYFPIVTENRTAQIEGSYLVDIESSYLKMRSDRFRQVFYRKGFPDPIFFFDTAYVSTYNLTKRDRSSLHALYPLKKYTNITRDPDNPNTWRFSAALNGSKNILETVWEFRPPWSVKFSYYLRNWTFIADHDTLRLNLQVSIPGTFYDGRPLFCDAPFLNETDIKSGAPNLLVGCSGDTAMNVTIKNYVISMNQSSGFGGISVDFPMYYLYDGKLDIFASSSPSACVRESSFSCVVYLTYVLSFSCFFRTLSPFGRSVGINFANFSSSPVPTYLREHGITNASLVEQLSVMSIGLEMKAFQRELIYDPTITLSLAFDAGSTPTPISPEEAASLGAGAIAGITVAIVAVVAIVLVVLFVPSVRATMQPFFRRNRERGDSMDDADGEAPPAGSESRPLSSEKTKKKGWVKAATPQR